MAYSPLSQHAAPFVIGVAGGSGSGKSTVVANLVSVLQPNSVVCLAHDDYYRNQDDLPMATRMATNYDHPSSLETDLLVKHLKQLLTGKSIQKPTYDFVHHTRAKKTIKISPAKVIIIEGILLFESKVLRELCNLKVFVDTDADLRVIRRTTRDMEQRGRTLEFSLKQYLEFTRPMHIEFVEPSKRHVDIIIPEGGHNTVALDLLLARVRELQHND